MIDCHASRYPLQKFVYAGSARTYFPRPFVFILTEVGQEFRDRVARPPETTFQGDTCSDSAQRGV